MTSDNISPLPEAEQSLREVVYIAMGAASVCWDNPAGAGVFREDVATQVAEDLLMKVKVITSFGEPSLGLATNAELREELQVRADLGHGDDQYRTMEPSRALWHIVKEPWVGKETLWQHRDFPSIFSTDRGFTWYNLEEPVDPDGNPHIYHSEEYTSA